MCACNPRVRTPNCGRMGCISAAYKNGLAVNEARAERVERARDDALGALRYLRRTGRFTKQDVDDLITMLEQSMVDRSAKAAPIICRTDEGAGADAVIFASRSNEATTPEPTEVEALRANVARQLMYLGAQEEEIRGLKDVLTKIASTPGVPKAAWNLAADALCWARKLEPNEYRPSEATDQGHPLWLAGRAHERAIITDWLRSLGGMYQDPTRLADEIEAMDHEPEPEQRVSTEDQPPLTITVPVSANEDTEITCLFCRRERPCEYAIKLHRPGETALVGIHDECLDPFRKMNPRPERASAEAKADAVPGLRDAAQLIFQMTEIYQHNPEALRALEDVRGAVLKRAGRDPKEQGRARYLDEPKQVNIDAVRLHEIEKCRGLVSNAVSVQAAWEALTVLAVQIRERAGRPLPSVLTLEELRVACNNIGYDITCGACSMRFFTGFTLPTSRADMLPPHHEATCKTDISYLAADSIEVTNEPR